MREESDGLPDDLSEETARRLHADHMALLGIEDTMSLARAFNRRRFAEQDRLRRRLFEEERDRLYAEAGGLSRPVLQMTDGWAVDRSGTLPDLADAVEQAREVVARRAGVRTSAPGAYRSFFQDVWDVENDPREFPGVVDFATSPDVVATVADYLGCIPALSTTLPSGIRVVESNRKYDDRPDEPHDSQLYHIDYYSLPNVYVLVLLEDTGPDQGPWTFLPRSVSQRVRSELGYWKHGRGYRLTDGEVYSVADPAEAIEFTGERGSVLFIESSGCLHFGSRNAVRPRFQMMLGYTGAWRTDLTEAFMPPKRLPVSPDDSLLRRLVLSKNEVPTGPGQMERIW